MFVQARRGNPVPRTVVGLAGIADWLVDAGSEIAIGAVERRPVDYEVRKAPLMSTPRSGMGWPVANR